MINVDQLISYAKPGSGFSPLDAAEMMMLNDAGDADGLKALAQDIVNRQDIPMDLRTMLNALDGVTEKAHDPVALMHANIRIALGTTGMAYPEEEAQKTEEDLMAGIEMDFGDDSDAEPPKEPSPLLKIATAVVGAIARGAQKSGQTSTIKPFIAKLEKAFKTRDLGVLCELYTKHTRELAMMIPYVAMDDEMEKALTEIAATYPFAQSVQTVIVQVRDQIGGGIQAATALNAGLTMLLILKGEIEHNA